MKTRKVFQWLNVAAILLGGALVGQPVSSAQQAQATEEGSRKVKSRVVPKYPELAHKLHLNGKVRLELVVEPDGHVRTVNVLGGHPVLADAATEAVKDWKYMPASGTTTENVTLEFKSADNN
jgi:TonB family protein